MVVKATALSNNGGRGNRSFSNNAVGLNNSSKGNRSREPGAGFGPVDAGGVR